MSVTAPLTLACIIGFSLNWIAAAQPATITPASNYEVAQVTGSSVRVRSQPTTGSTIVAQLNRGDEVVVLEQITRQHTIQNEPSEWCKVALPAWVSSRYLDPTTRSVRANRVNLRSGPGVNYPVLGILTPGTAVQTIETRGDWSRIQVPHQTSGFIAASLLTRKKPTPPPSPQPSQHSKLPELARRLEQPRLVDTSSIVTTAPSTRPAEESQQPAPPVVTSPNPSNPVAKAVPATDELASTIQPAPTTVQSDPEEPQPAPETIARASEPAVSQADSEIPVTSSEPSEFIDQDIALVPTEPEPELAEKLNASDIPLVTPTSSPSPDPNDIEVTSASPTLEKPDQIEPGPMSAEREEQARMLLREKLSESGTNAVPPAKKFRFWRLRRDR